MKYFLSGFIEGLCKGMIFVFLLMTLSFLFGYGFSVSAVMGFETVNKVRAE